MGTDVYGLVGNDRPAHYSCPQFGEVISKKLGMKISAIWEIL